MKKIYQRLYLASVFFLMTLAALAQQRVVTGTITDDTGSPLPGVNIIVKGTTVGTVTDSNGTFSIAATENDVLIVSFIGFKAKEVAVGAQTRIDVSMESDVATLQEVVVVGYGEQRKALNTGANLQVKGEDLQKLSTTNALQALQGQAPGVQITSISGQPGEGLRVTIRGQGSVNGSGPLYVVDGVLTGDVNYLNPADIQSIDVLKDAASAAIYGSQAANGVILITTKKGKSGHTQITFDSYIGVQNAARLTPMLNAQEYATIRNEAAVNSGKAPYYSNDSIAAMGAGTNWLDKMIVKNAPTRNYTLGASGGNESSVYSMSASYTSQAGIVGGEGLSNYDRYSVRFNSEHKLYKDRVLIGENLTYTYSNKNGIGVGGQYNNTLRAAFGTTPLLADNRADTVGLFNQPNPVSVMIATNQNKSNTQRMLGNVYLQIEPIKNLKWRTNVGVDFSGSDNNSYTPAYRYSLYSFNQFDKIYQSMDRNKTIIIDNLLNYGFNVSSHRFDVMVGSTAYQYSGNTISGSNTNSVFGDLDHAYLTNAVNKDGSRISLNGGPGTNGGYNPNKRLSYYGRLSYNYKETYLLNATFRADGSSQFASGNRWGYFPSVSAGWVMTNAPFLSGTSDWLNFLKLRASWGQVGNQNASAFQYMALLSTANTNYSFGPTEGAGGLVPGAYLKNLANANLKWETSQQTNIGFDASLLHGNLTVSLDWYNKSSKNWLIVIPVLATAGADAPYANGGNVVNRGIELALAYNNKIGDFSYKIGINGAYNQNKITDVPTPDHIINPAYANNQLWNNAPIFYRSQQGYPVGYFWGLQTNGIFQSEADVANNKSAEGVTIQPGAQPGDVRYVDRDHNGVIDDRDKTMIGNPNPKYTFGFNLALNYKSIDLSVLASGVAGNDIVQSYRNQSGQFDNYTTEILDRWHGPGTSNRMPRVTENNNNFTQFSDLYIHKGDFLRLNNITLGYNFGSLIKTQYLHQFRIYASVLNLYTFTKYNGMDPEIGYGPDPMAQGIDLGYYPRPRTYMVGVNVKF